MKKTHSIYAGLLFLVACTDLIHSDQFIIKDAGMNKPLAGQPFTAAYFEIKNLSDNSLIITGINCKEVETALLHSMKMDKNGLMTMSKSDIVVKSHSTKAFRPGASHVMLGGFSKILSSGDFLYCSLESKGSNPIPLSFKVN